MGFRCKLEPTAEVQSAVQLDASCCAELSAGVPHAVHQDATCPPEACIGKVG